MKSNLSKLLLLITTLAVSLQARGSILVGLEPSSTSLTAGSPFSVDLVISGLGNNATPSLAGFDFDLSFQGAVLQATSVTFGNHLDLGIFGSVRSSSISANAVSLNEVSLEGPSDLYAYQPFSFTLATLGFNAISPGTSTIDLTFGSLSDENGNSLAFTSADAQVQVTSLVGVPDGGSTLGLLVIAIGTLVALRQRQRRFVCPQL